MLRQSDDDRQFISHPPDSNSKRVVDLAILPIDTIPRVAIIDPIDLSEIDLKYKVNPGEELYVYGYRGNVSVTAQLPHLDTVHSIDDKSFDSSNQFIFAKKTIDFGGNSGGLVYNKDKKIVGVVSLETRDTTALRWPEFKNMSNRQLVYEFISISKVVSVVNELLP